MAKAKGPAPLFAQHALNANGHAVKAEVEEAFTELLLKLESITPLGGREGALVRTKLEEASMFAVKAVALRKVNQA